VTKAFHPHGNLLLLLLLLLLRNYFCVYPTTQAMLGDD
jgi:hypothetical protein